MAKSIRDLSSVTSLGLDIAKNVFQVHAIDKLRYTLPNPQFKNPSPAGL